LEHVYKYTAEHNIVLMQMHSVSPISDRVSIQLFASLSNI